LNKPVNEKRANAARLPLWMYVLAWLVRTTRVAEHDLNAAPIHGTGATATGDNSSVKERTPLELFAKIIEAYYNAYNSSEYRNLSLIGKGAAVSIVIVLYIGLLYYFKLISGVGGTILSIIFAVTHLFCIAFT
jgi:hypothetical protein